MSIEKFTKHQAIVLTGFTGTMCCNFSEFHADVEQRMGRPVWVHEFANEDFANKVKELYEEDFFAMIEAD